MATGAGAETTIGHQIALVDGSPTFRRGLAALLREAGHHPVELSDPAGWLDGAERWIVIMAVETATDREHVARLRDVRPDVVIIALLTELEADAAAAALRAGAASVIHRDDEPDRLLQVTEHAIRGDALLPVEIAQILAHTPTMDAMEEIGLTADEIRWIERLARNESVAKVAADAGLSERTLYRRLDHVFRRIGVNNRIEAIAWATRRRYIDI